MGSSTKHRRPVIYIEATALCRSQRTGVSYWVEGLITGLVAQRPDTDFVFFHFAGDDHPLRIKGKNVREITIKKMPGKLFRLLYVAGLVPRLEWLLGVDRVDLVIFPNFYAWPVQTKGARIIICIPDTTYLDVPEYVPHRYFRKLLAAGVKHSVKVSDELIVCSEATAQSLEDHYGRAVSTMTVAYPGYELPQVKPAQSGIDIPKQHILFVGTLEPRKNIANLIRGYVALPQKLRDEYPLMLAGGKGWLDEEIGRLIAEHTPDGVRSAGYVTDDDRELLYRSAAVFAYPVKYEGFGMPVIEAQAHGVPVVSTNNSSLPEATGGVAVYCETSSRSITQALKKILGDKKLRASLSAQGRRHAAKFTWKSGQDAFVEAVRRQS